MTPTSTPIPLGPDPVFDIALEVFTALIDQGETTLVRSERAWAPGGEVVHAWVEMRGNVNGRAVLRAETDTAQDLARALLGMDPAEEVSDADLVDAVGEVANVVGGNLKSLLAEAGTLGLPNVARTPPQDDGARLLEDLVVEWQGRQLGISVWQLA